MRVANGFSPEFIEGFVKSCQARGMSCEETELLFRKHANNAILARPAVFEGFQNTINNYEGPLRKSAMMRWLTPDFLALAEECRIKFGSDPLSVQIRTAAGIPEPTWESVPEHIKEAAANFSQLLNDFDHLPLNQKILLASMMGAGLEGGARAALPTEEDQMLDRGALNRFSRGAIHGGATGAGVAAGAASGSSIAQSVGAAGATPNSPDFRLPALLAGGAAGGIAGSHLSNSLFKSGSSVGERLSNALAAVKGDSGVGPVDDLANTAVSRTSNAVSALAGNPGKGPVGKFLGEAGSRAGRAVDALRGAEPGVGPVGQVANVVGGTGLGAAAGAALGASRPEARNLLKELAFFGGRELGPEDLKSLIARHNSIDGVEVLKSILKKLGHRVKPFGLAGAGAGLLGAGIANHVLGAKTI